MRKVKKYSACFATPVSLETATQEMRRLQGVHLLFRFYLVNKGVEHHEPDATTTELMDACSAYNWIAGQFKAVCAIGYSISVQLYK